MTRKVKSCTEEEQMRSREKEKRGAAPDIRMPSKCLGVGLTHPESSDRVRAVVKISELFPSFQ
jgi:hypothetical protein